MPVERGKIEGAVELSDELQLDGMVAGDVTVLDGGHLILRGTCCKNLLIRPGGTVDLYGTVSGDVTNQGGFLEVHGIIRGKLNTIDGGDTYVDVNAQVNGGRVSS